MGASLLPGGIPGSVVDMSEDGRRIAVGAPEGDGFVQLYELDFTGNAWNLLVEIPGEPDEGFGDALSLSPDGLLVAVRRHHVTPNAVQVYQIFQSTSSSFHFHPVGPIVPCPANGTEVKLGQATLRDSQGTEYYLLVSCEGFEDERGMVQAYKLVRGTMLNTGNTSSDWIPYLPALTGARPGEQFGFASALVEAPSLLAPKSTLRIAVSSPYRDSKRGAVQVFAAEDTSWKKLGNDLVGTQTGEMFGSSLAMSSTTQPYVLVGSPMKRLEFNPQGMVQLFQWRSPAIGEVASWQLVRTPLVGLTEYDSLGHAVAITRDGGRLAATSIKHDSNRGYVVVSERYNHDSWRLVGYPKYGVTHGEELGTSVSLNSVGSVVAIVALRGADGSDGVATASTWLDETPFCQVPESVRTSEYNNSVLDAFLDRLTCHKGLHLIDDVDSCVSASVFANGQWQPCEWESLPLALSADPSETPPAFPHVVEDAPTSIPSVNSPSPSGSPHVPTPQSYDPTEVDPMISHPEGSGTPLATSMPTYTNSENQIPEIAPTVARDNETELQVASNISETPSQVPSDLSVQDIPYVRACHCNDRNACISEPLSKGLHMNLCLRILSPSYSFGAISQLVLEQRDFSLEMIQDYEYSKITDQPIVKACHGGFCSIALSLPSYLFEKNRPPIVTVAGRVALERTCSRSLRGLSEDQPHEFADFRTIVKLEDLTMVAEAQETSSSGNQKLENALTILFWIFLGLLGLIGAFCFFIYIARKT